MGDFMKAATLSFVALIVPAAAHGQTSSVTEPVKHPPVCLRQDMVYGWKVVNDQTLIVTDRVQKAYKVTLKPGCLDLQWPIRLGFQSASGFGISCLTRNDFLIVPPAK